MWGLEGDPMGEGLSRRDMIKSAAAAGAVAWTAPVIIDSLASPAAAASCPCDQLYVARWQVSGETAPTTCETTGGDNNCFTTGTFTEGCCPPVTSELHGGVLSWKVTVSAQCEIKGACAKYGEEVLNIAPEADKRTIFIPVLSGTTHTSHIDVQWCCCSGTCE
jgi:hypothetical protein